MLLILAALLACATIVESSYSTFVAQRFVYGAWWFSGFLVLLTVNLICSASSRFPWKKHQIGFVITHLGVVLILAGSFVTRQWGSDGQITLREGSQSSAFLENKPTLYYQINDGAFNAIPADFVWGGPSPGHPLMILLSDGLIMVDQFYLNAENTTQPGKTEPVYEPRPLPHRQEPQPALHYEVIQGTDKTEGWLGYQGSPVSRVFSGGMTVSLGYGPKQEVLPFLLRLVQFHVGFDPGTEKPASFVSDVEYLVPGKGTWVPAQISMNKPLHCMSYAVYQAGYGSEPDGKYVSTFSVGRDPGIWVKYAGAMVLVLGAILMFWFKNPGWDKRENNG